MRTEPQDDGANGDDMTAAIEDRLPIQDAMESVDRGQTPVHNVCDAAAGAIWALAHILGTEPDKINKLTIDPDAGLITAEVWGEPEPVPYGPPGATRPSIAYRRWSYRTPQAIALELVTRTVGDK